MWVGSACVKQSGEQLEPLRPGERNGPCQSHRTDPGISQEKSGYLARFGPNAPECTRTVEMMDCADQAAGLDERVQ